MTDPEPNIGTDPESWTPRGNRPLDVSGDERRLRNQRPSRKPDYGEEGEFS